MATAEKYAELFGKSLEDAFKSELRYPLKHLLPHPCSFPLPSVLPAHTESAKKLGLTSACRCIHDIRLEVLLVDFFV